jgi:hypothetical protein
MTLLAYIGGIGLEHHSEFTTIDVEPCTIPWNCHVGASSHSENPSGDNIGQCFHWRNQVKRVKREKRYIEDKLAARLTEDTVHYASRHQGQRTQRYT